MWGVSVLEVVGKSLKMSDENKPHGVLLFPLESLSEADALDDVLYLITSVNSAGEIEHDLRTDLNANGGGCDCCRCGISVSEAIQDPSCHVKAYRYEVFGEADETLIEAWRERQKIRMEKTEILMKKMEEELASVRQAVRDRGTPVLDVLRRRREKRAPSED